MRTASLRYGRRNRARPRDAGDSWRCAGSVAGGCGFSEAVSDARDSRSGAKAPGRLKPALQCARLACATDDVIGHARAMQGILGVAREALQEAAAFLRRYLMLEI